MPAYYLDARGRAKDAARHTTLPRDAERTVRALHPRDARSLELDRMTPWSAEREAEAAAVRAGIAPPPERVPEAAPEPAPELMDPAPDWSPSTDPQPTPDPEPSTDPQPTADPTGDPTATDPQPTATDPQPAAGPLGFEPQTYGDPDPDPAEATDAADAPRDPDCPCCATEARTCARGHHYVPVTEEEARALLYMTDGAICALKFKRSGLPQIPLVAMASEDACAAMGMPAGSHQAAEAMVQAARLVMQKRGAFFAQYADVLGLLGATMMIGQCRGAALAGRAAAPPAQQGGDGA